MTAKKGLKQIRSGFSTAKKTNACKWRPDAPQSVDHLCEECRAHFKDLLEYLDELEIPFEIDPNLVRGLDYYTKTVFELFTGFCRKRKRKKTRWAAEDGLTGW